MENTSAGDQFQALLTAAKERRGDLNVDTMVVSSHLAQMRMFILRRGIEFYADQDSYGSRKEFLKKVCEFNMLEMKLDSIVDYFLCDGQGLFYFRPSGDNYQLLYFPKESYRCYRSQNDEIESVVLIYSFNVHEPSAMDMFPTQDGRSGKKKYIKLHVFKDRIEQTISNERIDFENEMGTNPLAQPGETETLTNSLGFIPAVEIFNHMDCTGDSIGTGEFDWLQNQILYHDELTRNIRKNMKFFGNPTLVSSRPKHDIIESGDEGTFRPTISSQAGFYAQNRPSTRVSQPFGNASPLDGQIKVPRVIANLEATDRINYLTPDSVSGDQNMYVKQYRSEIRLALGGVDDIDFGTASTAYEMKSMYGRVAATAEKKARALFTYGLCKLFGMMIYNEEELFNISFGAAIGLEKPVPPLQEDFQGDQEAYEKENEKFMKAMQKYMQTRTEEMRARLDSGEIPPGVTGLIPDGDTQVAWRWTGEIFEDDTQDILNNSIVVRNLQELGVDSIEALKYLFPGKTDEERAAMLSGYPFRMVQQTQQSISSFIGLLGNLYQLPHPQMPNMPLAADPNLDITGFLYRSLEFLRKELSYSGRYQPSSSSSTPTKLSDADRIRSERGLPTRDEPKPNLPGVTNNPANNSGGPTGNLPAGSGPAGFGRQPGAGAGAGGQSMAGGVPGSQRLFEYKQPIPSPGSVLGLSDTDKSGFNTTQLGFNGQFGDPSAMAEQNINVLRNANPGGKPDAGGAAGGGAAGRGKRRVPKRRK